MSRTRRLLEPTCRVGRKRHFAYADCSDAEYAVIRRFAQREGLTVADFVRRCVNAWLMEEGDDVPLLAECTRDSKG